MKTGFVCAGVLFAASVAACGGKVIWVEDGGPNGGAGGSSTSHTSTTSKSSTVQQGTSVVGTSVVGTAVATSNNVSVGDVMPLCDTGQPGDFGTTVCDDCINCAISSTCFNEANAYQSNPDAQAFNDCISNCMGPGGGCFQMCQNAHPQGAMLYFAIVQCIACNACPNNCNAQQNCMLGGTGGGPGGGMGNGPGGGPGGAPPPA